MLTASFLAFPFGFILNVSVLILAGAGQGALAVFLDFGLWLFWAIALFFVGSNAVEKGLRVGRFGLPWCLALAITIVGTVSFILLFSVTVLMGINNFNGIELLFWNVLWPMHLGVLYGGFGGLLFWRRLTKKFPELAKIPTLARPVSTEEIGQHGTGTLTVLLVLIAWSCVIVGILWSQGP